MSLYISKYIIEGLDRLGKDTLIDGILQHRGFHQVIHYGKPPSLRCYEPSPTGMTAQEMDSTSKELYQRASFRTMFQLLKTPAKIIMNRAHLGECVYAPLYRYYSGDYVFSLEREFKACDMRTVRLILLTEDFKISRHFVDDGNAVGHDFIGKREREQELFISAFERSLFSDKRIICVTDEHGGFKHKDRILEEALVP